MRFAPLFPVLGVLVPIIVGGCSAEPPAREKVTTSQQAIVTGPKDTADVAAVMVIVQEAANPTGSATCTATVVSPHVVLTAAHCLDERIVGMGKSWYVFLGDDVDNADQLADKKNFGYAKTTHFHPGFDPSTIGGASPPAHDIGVIVLLDKLPITPIALQREALTAATIGLSAHVVGYGKVDAANDMSSGIRRDNTTPIVGYDANTLWTEPATHGLCEGDSGGPSYLTGAAGKITVAGVHSYIEHNKSCTGKNYDTRVDVHIDWIEPFIRSADPGFLPDTTMPDAGADPVDASTAHADPAPAAAAPAAAPGSSGGCMTTPARSDEGAPAFLIAAIAALAIVRARRSRARS